MKLDSIKGIIWNRSPDTTVVFPELNRAEVTSLKLSLTDLNLQETVAHEQPDGRYFLTTEDIVLSSRRIIQFDTWK